MCVCADKALSADRLPGHVHRFHRVLLPFPKEEGEQNAGACFVPFADMVFAGAIFGLGGTVGVSQGGVLCNRRSSMSY